MTAVQGDAVFSGMDEEASPLVRCSQASTSRKLRIKGGPAGGFRAPGAAAFREKLPNTVESYTECTQISVSSAIATPLVGWNRNRKIQKK